MKCSNNNNGNRRRIQTRAVRGSGANVRNIFHAFLPKSSTSSTATVHRPGLKSKTLALTSSHSPRTTTTSSSHPELVYVMRKDIIFLQERVEKLCERVLVLENQLSSYPTHSTLSSSSLTPVIQQLSSDYSSYPVYDYNSDTMALFTTDTVTTSTIDSTTSSATVTLTRDRMTMSVKVESSDDSSERNSGIDDDDEQHRQFETHLRHLSFLNAIFRKKYFPDGIWDESQFRLFCTRKAIDPDSCIGKRLRTITIEDLPSTR